MLEEINSVKTFNTKDKVIVMMGKRENLKGIQIVEGIILRAPKKASKDNKFVILLPNGIAVATAPQLFVTNEGKYFRKEEHFTVSYICHMPELKIFANASWNAVWDMYEHLVAQLSNIAMHIRCSKKAVTITNDYIRNTDTTKMSTY